MYNVCCWDGVGRGIIGRGLVASYKGRFVVFYTNEGREWGGVLGCI